MPPGIPPAPASLSSGLSAIMASVVTKSTRKKFAQSWVFNILKRQSTIPPNEEIIRYNICNVELQPNICDV